MVKFLNFEEDSLNLYLKDVRKNGEVITIDEEVELAKRIQLGDEKALSDLVNANLRFVIKIAKEYQNQGVPVADLISEGNYGLITAAKKFAHVKLEPAVPTVPAVRLENSPTMFLSTACPKPAPSSCAASCRTA